MDLNCNIARNTAAFRNSDSRTPRCSNVTVVGACATNNGIRIWQLNLHMFSYMSRHPVLFSESLNHRAIALNDYPSYRCNLWSGNKQIMMIDVESLSRGESFPATEPPLSCSGLEVLFNANSNYIQIDP